MVYLCNKFKTERGPERSCRINTYWGCTSGGVMYLVFTRMPGESYRRWLRSLLLYLCDVFRALCVASLSLCQRTAKELRHRRLQSARGQCFRALTGQLVGIKTYTNKKGHSATDVIRSKVNNRNHSANNRELTCLHDSLLGMPQLQGRCYNLFNPPVSAFRRKSDRWELNAPRGLVLMLW